MVNRLRYHTPNRHQRFSKTLVSVALGLVCSGTVAQQVEQEELDSSPFETIVVTSQKRVQNIMQVPVTVSAVSADLVEESNSELLSDVDKFVPGFEFGDGSMTQASVSIRGISSPSISVGGDPSSATFYDDVYMPRAAQNVLFSDLERIEILKGPQGTLFGRNAAMGVVSIIPRSPNEFSEGFVKATFATDSLMRFEGMGNIALNDRLFFRANAMTTRQDGVVDNIASPAWNSNSKIWDLGARDHTAARFALRWELSSATQLQFAYELDDLEQAPPMAVGLSEFAFNQGQDLFARQALNDVRNGVESREMSALTAKVWHQFNDDLSMKGVVSHREWETVNREDEDGTADITRYLDTSNNEDSSIFYTEWQLNYSKDKVNLVTGVSYSKENVKQQTELNLTADTVARLTTQELNGQIQQAVAGQLAGMLGGMSDENAAAVFGPGVSFNDAVDITLSTLGLPMDHIWNANEWASALNVLGVADPIMAAIGMPGMTLDGNIVSATGDLTYDIVAQQLGVAEIYGPSFSGQFWQENVYNTGDFTNWGIFADLDYAVTDKWNVIAGIRYSNDKKAFTWNIPATTFASVRPGVANALFPQVDLAAEDSWSKITGRLVSSYQIDQDQMVFGSISTGYKSGGFDSLVPIDTRAGQKAFAPEDSTNFELGYKAKFNDDVIINLALYHTELDNFQISVESRAPGSNQAIPSIINQNREIRGLEIDVKWNVTSTLLLGAVSEIRTTDIDSPEFYNANGELVAAKSESFDASTNYTLTLNWMPDVDFADVNLFVDYEHVENINEQEPEIEDFKLAVPAYFKDRRDLNARLSFASLDGQYEVGLWGKNITDNRYVESISGISAATLGTPFARINRGREVGVDLKVIF